MGFMMRPVAFACAAIAGVSLSAVLWSSSAAAQDADAAIAATLDCRSISKPGPRLDCFDKAVKELAAVRPAAPTASEIGAGPASAPRIIAAPRPNAAPLSPEEAEAAFGAEKVESLRREREAQLPKRIASPVKSFEREPGGSAVFRLENGQVWRQVDADNTPLNLRKGRSYSLVIKRGIMGSYMATVPELKRYVRVERIE
jgi:hypothetical protein